MAVYRQVPEKTSTVDATVSFLTVFPATLLTDLQLGYQAVRRFPGGKQTTEVAAGCLARPSDKPHYPLYLLPLLSLLSPHPENRDTRYKGRIGPAWTGTATGMDGSGMDRHRSYVSAPRSWHASSSNTRPSECRRRVRVFPRNPNRIVINELGLGLPSAYAKRMALQCVSFLPSACPFCLAAGPGPECQASTIDDRWRSDSRAYFANLESRVLASWISAISLLVC